MKKAVAAAVFALALIWPASVAAALPSWNLVGAYTVAFVCTSGDCVNDDPYVHSMTITTSDNVTGAVAGTGFVEGAPTFDWTVTGTVDGSNVTLEILWTVGSGLDRLNPLSTTGTIDAMGGMSGTAIDGNDRTFTWSTTAGAATAINRTPPTATLIAPSTPTNVGILTYTVGFNKPVTGLAAGDFTLSIAGTATGCVVGAPSGSGNAYTVAVTGCSNGTVILAIKANSVTDADGNAGPAAIVTADPVTIDRTVPTANLTAPETPTNAASLSYAVDFDEPVIGLAAGDFTLTSAGTATGCVVGAPSGSGDAYTVAVNSCSDGTVILALEANSVSDAATNAGPVADVVADPVTVDDTLPTATLTAPASPTGASSLAYTLTFSETVNGLAVGDFTRTGTAANCEVGAPSGAGDSYTVAVNSCSDGTVILALDANSVSDAAGNAGPAADVTAATVTVDHTLPAATLTAPATPTNAAVLTYTVTFNKAVTGLAAGDFTRTGTATGCVVGAPSGSGDSYTVAVNGCSNGTVILALKAGSITDGVGNPGPQADVTAATVTIDRTLPATSSLAASPRTGVALSGSSIPLGLAWSGSDNAGGSGVVRYELARSTNGGAWTTLSTSLTAKSTIVTAASTGTVRYRVRAVDAANNAGAWTYGLTLSPRLTQQSSGSVKYTGSWTSRTSTVYSGGSAKSASTAGRAASYTFTGRSIALVTTRAALRGKVKVYVNGAYVTTVDLSRSATQYRVVAWQKTWSTSSSRTVKLIVVGTSGRPRVDLDAFVVVK